MKTVISVVLPFLFVFCVVQTSTAQDLAGTLKHLSQEVASEYVNPIVSGFGADLNTGWMYRVPKATTLGLDLDFGLVVMGSFMPSDAKTVNKSASFQFRPSDIDLMTAAVPNTVIRDSLRNYYYSHPLTITVTGPTIIGSGSDNLKVHFSGTSELALRDTTLPVAGLLENFSILPFVAPQLGIGTVYGTRVIIRYLPDIKINDKMGKFSYFGFGIQHNPFMWIPLPEPPLDVSLGFFTQTMKVGSIIETKATMFGVQASKTFGPGSISITPYGGLSIESSSMTFSYDFDAPDPNPLHPPNSVIPTPISFKLEGKNNVKFTLGASLKLALFKLNADYNIAKYSSFSAGIGIII